MIAHYLHVFILVVKALTLLAACGVLGFHFLRCIAVFRRGGRGF